MTRSHESSSTKKRSIPSKDDGSEKIKKKEKSQSKQKETTNDVLNKRKLGDKQQRDKKTLGQKSSSSGTSSSLSKNRANKKSIEGKCGSSKAVDDAISGKYDGKECGKIVNRNSPKSKSKETNFAQIPNCFSEQSSNQDEEKPNAIEVDSTSSS